MKRIFRKTKVTATKSGFRPWQFDYDPKVPFVTAKGPDGFFLVIHQKDFANLYLAFMSNYGHYQWPATMAGFFNPPIQVENPIEFAFAEILVRMTPEGYNKIRILPGKDRTLLDMNFELCLGAVCFFGGDEFLQQIAAEASKGMNAVPGVLVAINRVPPREGESGDLGYYAREWHRIETLLAHLISQIPSQIQ